MKNDYTYKIKTALRGLIPVLCTVLLLMAGLLMPRAASACSGIPASAGTATASPIPVCYGGTVSLSSSGADADVDIVYQWYSSTTSGGPYSPVSGATDTVATSGSITSDIYFVMSAKCTTTGDSVLSNEVAVTLSLAPLSGVYTIGTPASCTQFTSIAAFVNRLNLVGMSGPVTLNVPAGYTETAPFGGISIAQCALSAGLRTSISNTLTIQKSGSGTNPIIAGAAADTGSFNAVFRLVGADYVTIDGINISGTVAHEYGYALMRCDGTDGAQNNIIKNCSITLNKNNTSACGIYSGSINQSGVAVVVTAASGANSNNAFYSNTISNVYFGIFISGYNAAAPYALYDQNNIIGASGLGNTISAFGNTSAAATAVAAGIYTDYNNNTQIRYNTIAGSGHTGLVSCIYLGTARWANVDVTNNLITATSAATSGAAHIYNIYNVAGSRLARTDAVTNTINISNNTIQNCAVPTASSGRLWGVGCTKPTADSLSAYAVNVTNNTFTGNNNSSTSASDGFAMMFCVLQVAVNQVTITGNTCTNNQLTGGAGAGNRMIVTGSPGLTPLWEATWNISNNTLTNNGVSAAGGLMTGIAMENYSGNSMLSGSITISGNTISGVTQTTAAATGTFSGITCTANFNSFIGAASIPATITNNTVSSIVRTQSTSGSFVGISATGVPTTLTMTGNQVINNSIGGTATGTSGSFTGVQGPTTNGAFIPVSNISNNTVTGNTHNGTGTSTLINAGGGISLTVNNNTIGNHVKTTIPSSTTSATITGIATTANQSTSHTISGNSIENIRILGISGSSTANTINGILNGYATVSETITNNTIKTLFSSGTATGYTANIFGIRSAGVAAVNRTVSGNIVGNLYTLGGNGVIRAIRSELGSIISVFKNRVYDIYPGAPAAGPSSTSTAVGISISAGTQHDVYNNIVGLRFDGGLINVPTYTGSNAVMGIEIANSTSTHILNVRYNTIRMSGTPGSGASFGSSGIAITNATAPIVELSNNIVNNLLSAGGTSPGFSVAYRRANALSNTNYSDQSNNNLFYAGTPGAANLIYFDGTNSDQTIADYKIRAGALSPARDASSLTENVSFLNTTLGANANFLHIDPAVPTLLEGGAKNIASITTDYDGDTRSTAGPDIGADEGAFIGLQPSFSSVTVSPSTLQCNPVDHVVTAVTVNGGAPVLGVNLNYSYNGTPAGVVVMTNTAANTWTGTIPAATSPANALVTWTLTAYDGTYSPVYTGASYKDAYLLDFAVIPTINPVNICLGQSQSLSAYFTSANPAAPTYGTATATTTADEEILNVTFSTINQSSTCTSMGSVGAGSTLNQYSNYTTTVAAPLVAAGSSIPFSVQIGTCGGNYGNRSVIYIDWNRDGDFTDANEQAATEPASVSGPHTWTGTITVPSNIAFGLTRMRVINNETSAVTPSVGTFSWGEVEDYSLNLISGAGYTYSWSDGTNTIVPTNGSYTPAAAGTYSYVVTGTDPNGCTRTSNPVTVTVNPLPASPVATASIQCGAGVPKVRVSGGSAYNWYLQATGGTAIQSSLADTLTSYSITATTTFYVAIVDPNTSCESPRTAVDATVTQPDPISASVNLSPVCPGTAVTLTATQTGSNNNYVFSWTGNGLVSTSGAVVTANPPSTGVNTYNVTAVDASVGCIATASVTVTGNPVPATVSANVTPTVICEGGSVNLSGGANAPIPAGYASSNASFTGDEEIFNVTFGTINNTSNCATVAPGPGSQNQLYSNYTTSVAPITLTPGQVVNYSVQVGTCGGNYTHRVAIFVDWNRDGDLLDAGENPVLSPPINGPGFATGTITVPAGVSAGTTLLRVIDNETTGSVSPTGTYGWGETEDYAIVLDPNPGATYYWSYNGTNIGSNTTQTHTPTSAGTAQYTLVVTGTNGCSIGFPATPVTVNPGPPAPSTTPSTQCGAAIPSASVTSVSGLTSPIFRWYTTATGGTPIQSSTATQLTSYLVTSTTTLYVSEVNSTTTCEGSRNPVLVTVLQPDSVAVSVSAGPYCLGGSITLNAVNTGTTNNYTYSWNGSPAGSGFSGAVSSATATVTPTAAGTYTYTLTAVDGICNYVGTIVVAISDNPAISNIGSNPAGNICSGSPVTLTATTISAGPQVQPTGYAASNALYSGDEEIFNVTVGSINNTSDCGTVAPGAGSNNQLYSNYTGSVAPANLTIGQSVSYSLVIGTCGGNYSNRTAIFIDYNRDGDFADAGENPVLSNSVVGPTTVSGTFVVPTSGVVSGLTRMRVVNIETTGSVAPTGTYGWGETEDYLVNLLTEGAGTYTWVWNPGALNGNSVVVNPTTSTTYTVTATNVAGCTSTSSISVNTIPLPTQPVAVDGLRCGFGPVNVAVTSTTGAALPAFNWYTVPVGGTPIQSSTNPALTGINVSVSDTFYVAEINLLSNPNCESPRTIVIQEVIQPDAVAAIASDSSVCLSASSIALNAVQTGNDFSYTFTWSASPSAGSGIDSTLSGASQFITPTLPGTYIYTVDAVEGDCAYQSSVTVVVAADPKKPDLGADQIVCAGTNLTFSVFTNTLIAGGIQSNATSQADDEIFNVTITGTSLNNSSDCSTLAPGAGSLLKQYSNYTTSVPAPTLIPGNSYSGSVTIGQCNGGAYACGYAVFIDFNRNGLFDLPAERVAAGPALTAAVTGTLFPFSFSLPANSVPGIARMRIVAVEGADGTTGGILPNGPYQWGETEDYAVRIDLNPGAAYQWSSIPAGFSSTSTTISTGPIAASTSYVVLVTNPSGCTISDTVAVTAITTPDAPVYTTTADSICISGTVSFQVTNISPGVSYQWQSAPSASGPWTDIFGATATNFITPNLAPVLGDSVAYFRAVASCGATGSNSVEKAIYISKPSITTSPDVNRCGPGSITLTATGNGNLDWYSAPSGGTSLFSGSPYTTTVTGSTTYYVGASVGSCQTIVRNAVIVTVDPAPGITASASPTSICEGASSTLTVSSSNSGYTYLWDGTVSGSSYTVTPNTTTSYTVTALDATTGCAAITNVTITVNKLPTITAVTSTPATVCPDQPFTLHVDAIATGPQIVPTGYCAAGGSATTADEQIFGVSFANINNLSQAETCGNNNTDYTSTIAPAVVNAGNTYPFTVVTDECDGSIYYSSGLAIYIDYNRDGDWDDVGEKAYTTTATTISPNTRTGSITIPLTASPGLTKMRVIVVESSISPAACQFFSYGEAEDYLVNILGPSASFSWTPSATLDNATIVSPTSSGIAATTTFTVTATSPQGCTSAPGSVTVNLSAAPQPVITTPDTILCNSELYVKVADGGPFAGTGYPSGTVYTWKDITGGTYISAANLDSLSSQGGSSFFVTVTLPSGCQATSDTAYIVTKAVSVTRTITDASCSGTPGSIVASMTSGLPPFNYVWSTDAAQTNVVRNVTNSNTTDTLDNLAPGTYYLSVQDEIGQPTSCGTGVQMYIVGGGAPISATISGTDISCNGAGDGSATVSSNNTGLSYLWSDGNTSASRSILTGGVYTVIVSNSGCADTLSITINEPTALLATLSSTAASGPSATDGTVTAIVSGGTTPYAIDWFDTNIVPVGSGSTVDSLAPGTYLVLIVDANNCQVIDQIDVPSTATMNLTMLIQGYYDGVTGMLPVLSNSFVGSSTTEVDTIVVELRDPLSTSTVVASATAVVNTDGDAVLTFPGSVIGSSYYIAVSHRNAVNTWSAAPVTITGTTTYDFTTSASQAYGDNMVEVATGLFAFFSGDIAPQDGVVDITDQSILDNDIFNFAGGYVVTDLSGDGVTDITDQSILDNNIFNFVGAYIP